jgi:hypothetical protein
MLLYKLFIMYVLKNNEMSIYVQKSLNIKTSLISKHSNVFHWFECIHKVVNFSVYFQPEDIPVHMWQLNLITRQGKAHSLTFMNPWHWKNSYWNKHVLVDEIKE